MHGSEEGLKSLRRLDKTSQKAGKRKVFIGYWNML
jgi:hypothetical protein